MDIYHWWSSDLNISLTGDLALVDGLDRGRQRILRRLLTNLKDYYFHPDYGAGVGARVGELRDIIAIKAAINTQIMKEACVGRSPLPVITVRPIDNGVNVSIIYQDIETGVQSPLQFDLTE